MPRGLVTNNEKYAYDPIADVLWGFYKTAARLVNHAVMIRRNEEEHETVFMLLVLEKDVDDLRPVRRAQRFMKDTEVNAIGGGVLGRREHGQHLGEVMILQLVNDKQPYKA